MNEEKINELREEIKILEQQTKDKKRELSELNIPSEAEIKAFIRSI